MEIINAGDLFKSKIDNERVLIIHPNCDVHNILNLQLKSDMTDEIYGVSDLELFKNKHYDYILCHAFFVRKTDKDDKNWNASHFNLFEKYNITGDVLVIEELGEGASLSDDVYNSIYLNKIDKYLKCPIIKWIAPFENYSNLESKYNQIQFFKLKLSSVKLFCNPQYPIIHSGWCEIMGKVKHHSDSRKFGNHVVMGLSWKPELKKKLYMCLNNEVRLHRSLLLHYLNKKNITNHGHVSYVKFDKDSDSKFRLNDTNGKDYETSVNVSKMILPWEQSDDLNKTTGKGNRFSIQTKVSEESFIDVVTESSTGFWPFITEKSMKPFYNLQFPIIYGHVGLIQKLRDVGFDMFDDIINHDYDNYDFIDYNYGGEYFEDSPLAASIDNIRIPKLVDELYRLSTIDIKSLYTKNKHRFIYNQNLLYNLSIEDNNLLPELGNFIFGDSFKYTKSDKTKFVKLYLNK